MPLALPAAAGLAALLLFILCVALAVMWTQILRGPLLHMAATSVARFHPFGFLKTVVTSIDHWIDSAEKGTERAMVWPLHAAMSVFATSAEATADLAQATWQALEYWKHHTTSHAGAMTGQSISPRLKTLEREYKGIEAELGRLREKVANQGKVGAAKSTPVGMNISGRIRVLERKLHGIDAQINKLTHADRVLGQRIGAQGKVAPRAVPRVVPRTRAPARHWYDVLTKAGLASLGVALLARLGLGFLRCTGFTKAGKRACGMDRSLLDALIADTLLVVGTLSLVEFAKEMETVTEEVGPLVAKFWRAV